MCALCRTVDEIISFDTLDQSRVGGVYSCGWFTGVLCPLSGRSDHGKARQVFWFCRSVVGVLPELRGAARPRRRRQLHTIRNSASGDHNLVRGRGVVF